MFHLRQYGLESPRVLDIMGCGGFVISNYQGGDCRAFSDRSGMCEIYENLMDLVVKTEFYLQQ